MLLTDHVLNAGIAAPAVGVVLVLGAPRARYGAHVNGFVRDPSAPGGLLLWVATRSKSKQTWYAGG